MTEPLKKDTEITGPIAAKLWLSSATEDADLFLVVVAGTTRNRSASSVADDSQKLRCGR